MLLEEIISRKKLRVTNVSTEFYLEDREACDLGTNASSLEAFCTLFLGKSIYLMNLLTLSVLKLITYLI
jgi:hypothetical protein